LPQNAVVPPYGPKNQIFLSQMGINTWVRSWIPKNEIVGMVIRHGEAFGISDRFTVYKNGKPIYRPTVHYAYMPCHETISSLHELRGRNYELQPKLRIMGDEIVEIMVENGFESVLDAGLGLGAGALVGFFCCHS
jgi:homospermidine synthase